MTIHTPPNEDELLDCKYEWCGRTGAHGFKREGCGRTGAHGFKREDHRKEHYRKVHKKETEYPRTGTGGITDRKGNGVG